MDVARFKGKEKPMRVYERRGVMSREEEEMTPGIFSSVGYDIYNSSAKRMINKNDNVLISAINCIS